MHLITTDIKLSITPISKIIQSGGSLLSKWAGPLMKVVVPLAKNILALLGIAAAASATDAGIQKKTWFWDNYFNNFKQKMNVTQWKLFKPLKILIFYWRVTERIRNETKEQKGGFLGMLLGSLGASLLGNLLVEKVIVRAGSGNKKGKGIVRAGYGNEMDF